jgi:hypothetical protein
VDRHPERVAAVLTLVVLFTPITTLLWDFNVNFFVASAVRSLFTMAPGATTGV